MDRRQLRAVIFLTLATATMCAAARPGPAHAAVPGHGARAGGSGAAHAICRSWDNHDQIAARMSRGIRAVLHRRDSIVAIRVQDPYLGIGCWYRESRHFDSASAVKVTILAALLRKAHAEHRALTARERWLAWRMITESDNGAATALWDDVGRYRLGRFLRLTGMRQTDLGPSGYWGLTRITARDELILLRHLLQPNPVLTKTARRYELHLMARVVPAQRWGVPAGAPDDFTVHVKNGWAPLSPVPGWFVNSIGCFTHGDRNYSVVVLTQGNPTMGYGVATVQDVAEVINRGLNPDARHVIAPSRPFPSWGRPDEPAAG
jgi:Beta-lactamase enzyme family